MTRAQKTKNSGVRARRKGRWQDQKPSAQRKPTFADRVCARYGDIAAVGSRFHSELRCSLANCLPNVAFFAR